MAPLPNMTDNVTPESWCNRVDLLPAVVTKKPSWEHLQVAKRTKRWTFCLPNFCLMSFLYFATKSILNIFQSKQQVTTPTQEWTVYEMFNNWRHPLRCNFLDSIPSIRSLVWLAIDGTVNSLGWGRRSPLWNNSASWAHVCWTKFSLSSGKQGIMAVILWEVMLL